MQQSNRTALSAMFAAGALACALTLGAAGSAFAVSARPVVAPPAPTAPPSTVYGQNGQSLPAPGITVRKKRASTSRCRTRQTILTITGTVLPRA